MLEARKCQKPKTLNPVLSRVRIWGFSALSAALCLSLSLSLPVLSKAQTYSLVHSKPSQVLKLKPALNHAFRGHDLYKLTKVAFCKGWGRQIGAGSLQGSDT